jgi:hypothetical protein
MKDRVMQGQVNIDFERIKDDAAFEKWLRVALGFNES